MRQMWRVPPRNDAHNSDKAAKHCQNQETPRATLWRGILQQVFTPTTDCESDSMKVGQVALKIAGRDAGKKAVVLRITNHKALVDGEVRRREINLAHLIPTETILDIKEDAPHEAVKSAFSKIGITLKEKKPKAVPKASKDPTPRKQQASQS